MNISNCLGRSAYLAGVAIALLGSAPTTAKAADIYKAPSAPARYDWSGFYVGAQGGGFYSRNNVTTPNGELLSPITMHDGNYFVGGFAGFNMQSGRFVYGVEADFSKVLGGRGFSSAQPTIAPGIFAAGQTDPHWAVTATARVGLALDNWLLYVRGGGAWMKADYTGDLQNGAGTSLGRETQSATRSGWLIGGGIEYGWSRNVVSRLEYNYIGFSNAQLNYTLAGLTAANFDSKTHLVKAGLAYKFGGL